MEFSISSNKSFHVCYYVIKRFATYANPILFFNVNFYKLSSINVIFRFYLGMLTTYFYIKTIEIISWAKVLF
jgi:hypothetical protein